MNARNTPAESAIKLPESITQRLRPPNSGIEFPKIMSKEPTVWHSSEGPNLQEVPKPETPSNKVYPQPLDQAPSSPKVVALELAFEDCGWNGSVGNVG